MTAENRLQGETPGFDFDSLDWDKSGDGLLPAIVQHIDTGAVLMLGYQDRTALAETLRRGRVVFFSRSRQALWEKGETSGNFLQFVAALPDCDRDAILIQARPAGPVCHTGNADCFGSVLPAAGFLAELEQTISGRQHADPDTSYTARLLQQGVQRIAQKVGEEGVETALAATAGDRGELRGEAADLVFHLLVLLQASELRLADVVDELASRQR